MILQQKWRVGGHNKENLSNITAKKGKYIQVDVAKIELYDYIIIQKQK